MITAIHITVCLLACALTLWSEHRNWRVLGALSKTVAAASFVSLAWQLQAVETRYGQWIFTGLLLSFCGDVLLIPRQNKAALLCGLLFFLMAHMAYAWGFWQLGFATERLPLLAPLLAAFTVAVWLWLRRHLSGLFKFAVPLYIAAITAMLLLALGNRGITWQWLIMQAAVLFALSDLFVARNRFVQTHIRNRLMGLPLYFTAQLMLALSVYLPAEHGVVL